jgi:hypothetical protein
VRRVHRRGRGEPWARPRFYASRPSRRHPAGRLLVPRRAASSYNGGARLDLPESSFPMLLFQSPVQFPVAPAPSYRPSGCPISD